ncbi:hypothetical protein OG535_20220 [Kitasatospora sp. NBC_00085]|uniref:hypothetical protein n=1 Tax=unclassified Kitasatospora TaxID=2633591 RepID=UPI00324E245A
MSQMLRPGLAELTVVGQGGDAPMRVIAAVVDCLTPISGLHGGLWTKGVYRRLVVDVAPVAATGRSLPDPGPSGDPRAGASPIPQDLVHVEVRSVELADAERVRAVIVAAYPPVRHPEPVTSLSSAVLHTYLLSFAVDTAQVRS